MNLGATVGGLLKARAKRQGRVAFGLTVTMTVFRIYRRLTHRSTKPVIRFAVKPDEVYEIRGVRRGR